jgi:hypothetical protein
MLPPAGGSAEVVIVYVIPTKVATNALSPVALKVYVADPETCSPPSVQFTKEYPGLALAARLTDAPCVYLPAPVTDPPPIGFTVALMAYCRSWKFATSDRGPATVIV